MKLVKKLTALFLAIVMTMAMGITAFADESRDTQQATTYTITINNKVKDYEYKAYKVFNGSLAEIDGKMTLGNVTWADDVDGNAILTALKADDTFEKDGENLFKDCTTAAQVAEVVSTFGDDSEKAVAFADIAGKNVKNSAAGVTSQYNEDATPEADYTISGLECGYYIVKNTVVPEGETYSRFILQVVDDVSVTPKVKPVDIDKNIIDNKKDDGTTDDPNKALDYKDGVGGKTDTAAIGDKIEFEITGKVPDYTGYDYYYYVVKDTMSKGLTLDTTYNRNKTFEVVVSWTDANGSHNEELTEATTVPGENGNKKVYYVQKTGPAADGSNSFEISFESIKQYPIDAKISVKYQATINGSAVVSVDEKGNLLANTNKAKVEYSNKPEDSGRGDKDGKPGFPDEDKPHGVTPEYVTKTYVTELNLLKVDQDGMPLKGAEFTLEGDNLNKLVIRTEYTFTEDANGTYYQLTDDTYTETAPTVNKYEGDGDNKKLVTKSNYTSYKDATSTDGGDTVNVSKKYKRTTNVSTTEVGTTNSQITVAVNNNGFVTFTGLNYGSYTLTESKTPEGYNTIAPIQFEIVRTKNNDAVTSGDKTVVGASITWAKAGTDTSDVQYDSTTQTFKVTIKNVKGSILPSTGGMGTTVIYIAGIAMIVAAGIVVIARKRFA